MRSLLPCFLLLFALPTRAQDLLDTPHYTILRLRDRVHPEPADSADFNRFCAAFATATPDLAPPLDLSAYRLVWDAQCEGMTYLTRGNGTDLAALLTDPPERRFGEPVCCPRFFGGRYAVVHWEPPTGLVRFHYWFFARR